MFIRYLILSFGCFTGAELFAQDIKLNNTYLLQNKSGYYQWKVFVDAPAAVLGTIESVQYLLDPSYTVSQVKSVNAADGFSYTATGQSEFEITAKISFKDKRKPNQVITYWLRLRQPVMLQKKIVVKKVTDIMQ